MLPEMCFVQCRPDMFDVACENVCYESLSVHDLAQCRYSVPVAYKAHGLVQGNDGLYHANAGLRGVARHKESVRIRAPLGPTGASQWAPSNLGPHDGPNGTGAGAEQKPPCAREQNTPARSPDVLSTTQKYAIVASRKGGCTSV